jgi:hypothetical protein
VRRRITGLVITPSPKEIQELADSAFATLKTDPRYPSLHLKRVGNFWSARVGIAHRVLGGDHPGGIAWFFIGTHADYDKLVG